MQWKVQFLWTHPIAITIVVIIKTEISRTLQYINRGRLDKTDVRYRDGDFVCSACSMHPKVFPAAMPWTSKLNAIHYLFMYPAQHKFFHMCWEYLNSILIHASQFHNTTVGYTTQFVNRNRTEQNKTSTSILSSFRFDIFCWIFVDLSHQNPFL